MHDGHEITYDWSNDNSTKIEWAAFYSDCKHEVFEVKSGYRVTLTYNLYISEHTGSVMQSYPTPNPSMYPLHDKVNLLLQNPSFMKNGMSRHTLLMKFGLEMRLQLIRGERPRWNYWAILHS